MIIKLMWIWLELFLVKNFIKINKLWSNSGEYALLILPEIQKLDIAKDSILWLEDFLKS